MGRRKVDTIILCEDDNHASFLTRVLKESGGKAVHYIKASETVGDAKQFVRNKFPVEVVNIMRRGAETKLIVMIDADDNPCDKTRERLLSSFKTHEVSRDKSYPQDQVAILVPKWSIEKWILGLTGKEADEITKTTADDKRHVREKIKDAASQFVKCVRGQRDIPECLPSLNTGVTEFKRVFA